MATTTIPWGDGSGDNIYLTYPSASGDQTVEVSSDANTGGARTQVVTFMAGNVSQALTVNQDAGIPYVSSGLVLWLDGIDKGQDSTAWIDKIGGIEFANHGATFNADHVYLNGSSAYLSNSSFPYKNSSTHTIEVVIDCENATSSNYKAVFMPKSATTRSIAFAINNAAIIWNANRTNVTRYTPNSKKGSFSICDSRGWQNGSAMSTASVTYLGAGDSTNYIGKRYNNANSFFKGKIHSIRIYSRILTTDEVLRNLAVDNERFNLGLTL